MHKSSRKGQAIVEMALVLPLFIFVILTIIDVSRGLHVASALNLQCIEAARAGARRMNFFVATDMIGSHTHSDYSTVKDAFERSQSPATGRCDALPAGSSFSVISGNQGRLLGCKWSRNERSGSTGESPVRHRTLHAVHGQLFRANTEHLPTDRGKHPGKGIAP